MRDDTQIARRRGRPPTYDRGAALAALADAFWDGGYSATSLDDLARATGMNRPSLYAAFGDKQAMYLAVLAGVHAAVETQLRTVLWSSPDPAEAVRRLLAAAVDVYLAGPTGPRGCLAVCTATTAAVQEPPIRAALDRVLATMDAVIAERLVEAGAAEPLRQARLVSATLHSLAVRARAGAARDDLLALAGDAATAFAR